MRRTILIVGGAAVLCLAALTVWASARRASPKDSHAPESELPQTRQEAESSSSAGEKPIDPHIFELPVVPVAMADGKFHFGYVDDPKLILYLWNDLVLPFSRGSDVGVGTYSSRRMNAAEDFKTIVPIDGLIKYRETTAGYRPGFFDHSGCIFFQWKGVVLPKAELLDKSQDGKTSLLDQDVRFTVIEIDMPARLKGKPELWKKGGAYTLKAEKWAAERLAVEKTAAEKKRAAEKEAAEKRARDPHVFTFLVGYLISGDVDIISGDTRYVPCYYDADHGGLFPWKGVALRLEQMPAATKGQPNSQYPLGGFPGPVVAIDALLKYRETAEGYRPGYLDHDNRVFFQWKGVVLKKKELLDKSQDGKDPLLDPQAFAEVIEIDMPAHLKKQPGLWKKP